jgi:hypothetical protein
MSRVYYDRLVAEQAAGLWNRARQNPRKAAGGRYLQKSLNGAALNCV